MNRENKISPPPWATQLLRWYCKPSLLEDLEGDLNEYFQRNIKSSGVGKANLIYVIDVFKFFRLYTIRKPEFITLLMNFIMIGSYIKTSGRSIVRNKLFSAINIVGLAISMSVGLLIISLISELLSYDDFHEKKDRIVRINTANHYLEQPIETYASTSVKAGKKIQESIAGIEAATILRNGFKVDATVGQNILPVSGLYADQYFFKVFTFPLLQGDATTALKEPYSLVITEKTKLKLFGQTDVLGKSIKVDSVNYFVTGVIKDIPKLSHLQFEALISFATEELNAKEDEEFLNWENIWQNHVYVLLPEHGSAAGLQANLDKLSASENAGIQNTKNELFLQPLKEIVIGPAYSNEIGENFPLLIIYILIGLAFIVIVSACFNYTNLSIARSMRRSREVGIRKVIGALQNQVLGQFMVEAVLISLVALVFSFFLFLFLRTQFFALHEYLVTMVSLELSPKIIFYFILLALVVGTIAGLLPSLFYSKINAIKVLKDSTSLQLFRHVTFRKVLIVIQYTFSLIFITVTIMGFNQYKGFLAFDLGFSTENILNIRIQGNQADQVVHELSQIPEITEISRSRMVTSLGNFHTTTIKYTNPQDSSIAGTNAVDENYLSVLKHQLIAGTNFKSRPKKGEESEVIVNEQVLKRFEIANRNPVKAIGEVLTVKKKKLTIVGVLKDFHYGSLEHKIQPVVFLYSSHEPGGYINAKVTSSDWPATLARIENAWRKIDKVHPLDAKFYKDQIAQHYSQFSVMLKVIGFLAFLAVCISSMGLFGMVVFTTETKRKETSIRKALGATVGSLVYLLGKGFLVLLAISALIALPVTYLFFDQVVLVNFAYHQPIGIIELIIGALVAMAVALLMICSQTLKVARTNPAEVLKTE